MDKPVHMFKQRFGSISRLDLAGYDFGTDQGLVLYRANDIKDKKCVVFTEEIADMATEVV